MLMSVNLAAVKFNKIDSGHATLGNDLGLCEFILNHYRETM